MNTRKTNILSKNTDTRKCTEKDLQFGFTYKSHLAPSIYTFNPLLLFQKEIVALLITVEDFQVAAAGRHFLSCPQCSLLHASAEESLLHAFFHQWKRKGGLR